MRGVLEDIRVLDFGRFIAGPYCGMILADMGAEVIRVDRPGGEEDRTHSLLGPDGNNLQFPSYARNKKGITLNLSKNNPQAREILDALVKQCDVVIHNFTPAAAESMGLTYDRLITVKPDIILTAISCFGSEGPYRNRPGFDFIAQAMSGAMACGGFADKPPIRSFINPMDYGTALSAAIGTLLALRHRDKTGEGQMVDLSLLRTAISFTAPIIAEKEVLGRSRPRIGNRAPYLSPTDLYACKDGYVFIASIMNSLWRRLAKVIGHEELLKDPELSNDLGRFEHRDRIDPLVADWIKERTVEEVLTAMEAAHIPCSPYYELDEVSRDPHVMETGMLPTMDMEVPGLKPLPISPNPVKLSKTPGRIETRAPRVGEHNLEIYGRLLGYSQEVLDDLTEKGIL
ncbi:MAG: CoA transferase [Proteobacteria bacterium]|nr:CoA transferase [Pseudomonadota bacterium]MBU4471783.1 CoA transferase [Pseudomonadota bacterium]MCG2750564.1 CoA transferase [Desulfobacteraceae bacterium]